LIVADSAEPRLIQELSQYCNIVPTIKGQGSITFGISLLQDYELIVDPDSDELIKELKNYVWLEKRSQTPCDAFNHLLDALRYCVSYQLANPHRGEYFVY
jgi:phage terminase large subunit